MDLRLLDAEPTAAERDAVDAFLGPSLAAWSGTDAIDNGHAAHGGHAARSQRHMLLPTLHALHERAGLDQPGRPELRRPAPDRPARRRLRRGDLLRAVLDRGAPAARGPRLRRRRLPLRRLRSAHRRAQGALRPRGHRRRRRLVAAQPVPGPVRPGAGGDAHRGRRRAARARADARGRRRRSSRSSTAARRPSRPRRPRRSRATRSLRLLRRVGPVDPESLDDYRAHGGYDALRRAIELGPEGVIREVIDSGIVGRGGAAFPMGRKWDAVARQPRRPHYLICNADESEPGTFKDRVLMEGDPFAVVEAMTIAAYATGCEQRLPLRARRVPARARAHHARDRAGPRARLPRPRHPRPGLRLRHRGAQGRRRLHLRRGDRGLRLDRGLPRRAAQQAAVPRRRGALRPADRGQQRRDARQRPADRARGRPGVRADRHREVDGPEALLRLGRGRHARAPTRSPFGTTLRELLDARGRGRAATCRPCCWAAPPAASSRPTSSTCASRRGRARVPHHARVGRRARHRRHGRPRAPAHGHRRLHARRELRAVRALPGRHRAPGGGGRAAAVRAARAAACRTSSR